MASSKQPISTEKLFSIELAKYPQTLTLFDEKGDIRTNQKPDLKKKIQVISSYRKEESPTVLIFDACAILWTLQWPASQAKL